MHGGWGSGSNRRAAMRMARHGSKVAGAGEVKKGVMTLDDLPADLRQQLGGLLEDGEEVKITLSTDLRFDGTYGRDWVLATDRRLIAFNHNGAPGPDLRQVLLSDIEKVEIRELHGNNILKVRTSDQALELARYSKTLAADFTDAAPEIEELVHKARPAEEEGAPRRQRRGASGRERKKTKCETCGRPIPHWSDVCPHCIDQGKLIVRLLRYALPFWRTSLIALIIMAVVRAASIYPGILRMHLFDDVLVPAANSISSGRPVATSAWGQLVSIVLLMIGINVFSTIFSAVRSYMMAWVGQHVTLDLRNEAYEHLNMLSLDFYQERDTGNLMARITHDVDRLQDFIAEGLQDIIGDSLMLVFMCGVMLYYNWQLTLWALIPIPLLVFFTIYYGEKMHKVFHLVWRRVAGISTILASTIPGVRVVKAFVREDYEISRFRRQSESVFEGEMSAARLWTVYGPTMSFLTFFGTIIIWFVGGNQLLNGRLTVGELTMFMGYMMQFFGPVQTLCNMNRRFLRAATSAERVFEILDTPPKILSQRDSIELPEIRGDIEFRDVVFSYDGEQKALDGVSFRVEPGEMIGLVGHSGAGKTTVINLITRFYDVDEGEILVDGHDVRDVDVASLRRQIGVVLQDPFLFQGTIAENIGYSKPGATRREIVAAAKAANAHEFIVRFPEGYDTLVGERGARVSGGERQRISIARAILKNPRILILDEATSSVDTETESKIQEALERLIRGRTVFAIAHRLSTLKHSHRLIVLKEGKIDEIGTHEELIAKDGTYASLCRKQTELSRIRAW